MDDLVSQLRCHALTYAVEAWKDHRDFPSRGQEDARTKRIVETAEAFAAFLTAEPKQAAEAPAS